MLIWLLKKHNITKSTCIVLVTTCNIQMLYHVQEANFVFFELYSGMLSSLIIWFLPFGESIQVNYSKKRL